MQSIETTYKVTGIVIIIFGVVALVLLFFGVFNFDTMKFEITSNQIIFVIAGIVASVLGYAIVAYEARSTTIVQRGKEGVQNVFVSKSLMVMIGVAMIVMSIMILLEIYINILATILVLVGIIIIFHSLESERRETKASGKYVETKSISLKILQNCSKLMILTYTFLLGFFCFFLI